MTSQKFIKYNVLKSNGQTAASTFELKLNVLQDAGNYLVHKNLVSYCSAQKQGTFSTKTRSEVRGGGKKPWQQKGTGRARAGSNRSPLWRGGGVIFGPKPRTTILKVNKKERKLALQTLLYNKKNSIVMIEDLEEKLSQSKTKDFLQICNDCEIKIKQNVLLVVSNKSLPIKLSTRNLKNVELIAANNLNVFDLLKANQIILTLPAIHTIKETYCD